MRLIDDEKKLIDAVRKLKAEAARLATTPAELLEHGFVSQRRAAELVGLPLAEVRSMRAEGRLPVVKGGLVPLSEVRRLFKRTTREKLKKMHADIARMFAPRGTSLLDFLHAYPVEDHGHSLDDCAKQLGLSKAAVRRHAEPRRGLFVLGTRRGGFWVTEEELSAYSRRLNGGAAA